MEADDHGADRLAVSCFLRCLDACSVRRRYFLPVVDPGLFVCLPLVQTSRFTSFFSDASPLCSLLCLCRQPYDNMSLEQFRSSVALGSKRPHVERRWPPSIKSVLRRSWKANPAERPSFREILEAGTLEHVSRRPCCWSPVPVLWFFSCMFWLGVAESHGTGGMAFGDASKHVTSSASTFVPSRRLFYEPPRPKVRGMGTAHRPRPLARNG